MASQAIRSIGFAQLSCDLKSLRISRAEQIIGLLMNILSIASNFAVQGLGGGFTVLIREIPDLVLCYKAQ